jgi:hypothetical protein
VCVGKRARLSYRVRRLVKRARRRREARRGFEPPSSGGVRLDLREGRGRGEQDRRSRVAGAAELVSLADLQRVAETFFASCVFTDAITGS